MLVPFFPASVPDETAAETFEINGPAVYWFTIVGDTPARYFDGHRWWDVVVPQEYAQNLVFKIETAEITIVGPAKFPISTPQPDKIPDDLFRNPDREIDKRLIYPGVSNELLMNPKSEDELIPPRIPDGSLD